MTVRARTLWLAGFGGAAAWSLHLLTVVAAGSTRCVRASAPVPRFGPMWLVVLAITATALVGAAWATWRSVRNLQRPGLTPSAARIRFMAFGGLLLNIVFLIGLVFSAVALALVPLCG